MRNLASIQRIKKIEPIENADAIEKISILGWNVVSRKGEFQENDFCVYFEIDSMLPDDPRYEFLKKTSWNPRYNKIRLKTIRLRGVISQGLALPLSKFPELETINLEEGTDVTDLLNVEKYEPIIPASLSGDVNKFTWPITKTDEIRVQNSPEKFISELSGKPYYITIKLDGTSASFILTKVDDELQFHVCSRNYSIKYYEDNTLWQIAKKENIEQILKDHYFETGELLSIQGEVCGPGIQKNLLNLPEHRLFVFNIVNTETNQKLSFDRMLEFSSKLMLVPVLEYKDSFNYSTLEELLSLSEGKYKEHISTAIAKQEREGIVVRSQDQEISFKVINNKFLLNGGD